MPPKQESALRSSSHSRGTSQCRAPPYSTGSLVKRCTSFGVITPERTCAKTALPLSAPRSNARYGFNSSGIGRDIVKASTASFFSDTLHVATFQKRLQRIARQAFRLAPFLNCATDVGIECILQQGFRTDKVGVGLC